MSIEPAAVGEHLEPAAMAEAVARRAAETRSAVRALTGHRRRAMLHAMGEALLGKQSAIIAANERDLAVGEALAEAIRDRLRIDESRLRGMADAVHAIADQPDPLGRVVDGRVLGNGIRLERRRVPLGTVLVIYESRPNVTSDAAALCLKAGNAVVLKGGSEALHTNRAIVRAIREPLAEYRVGDALGFVDTPDRSATMRLVTLRGVIDLVIPRGGPGLINAVASAATVPVVKHDAGNCHIYIDAALNEAGIERAIAIVLNAKTQRPGVCNAVETVLVHRDIAAAVLPRLGEGLVSRGVELRGDDRARAHLSNALPASEADWATEFLALILAVRVVESLDEACRHIARYSSGHTEAIITDDLCAADQFVASIDSASVMVNCSTRFADGGEYGLGAEIGISTDKLHARGPMGAEDLTTTQWIARGDGQIRE